MWGFNYFNVIDYQIMYTAFHRERKVTFVQEQVEAMSEDEDWILAKDSEVPLSFVCGQIAYLKNNDINAKTLREIFIVTCSTFWETIFKYSLKIFNNVRIIKEKVFKKNFKICLYVINNCYYYY